jgi:HEPN domain-containing protein
MRQDAEHWLMDGQNDLADARNMADNGMYNWAVFAARQAVEKTLKAAHIVLRRQDPPTIHSLTSLVGLIAAEVPQAIAEDIRDLSRHYVTTRYPDSVDGLTADAYSLVSANTAIAQAERVITWISQQLPSTS